MKSNNFKILLLSVVCLASQVCVALDKTNFNSWYTLCKKELPFYRKVGQNFKNTTLSIEDINKTVDEFLEVSKKSSLAVSGSWLSCPPKLSDKFFQATKPLNPIKPFVQKVVLNPGAVIAFHGDFHGDVHSLLEFIKFLQNKGYMESSDGFKIKDTKKFNIMFLGDYTDRGNYGTEVLYTILRIKIANPDNVFMVRGNHEDIGLAKRYGFYEEFITKFKHVKNLDYYFNKLTRIYDILPVAIYLGVHSGENFDFLQCCHGGMELGYSPKALLAKNTAVAYQWLEELWKLSYYDKFFSPDLSLSNYFKDKKIKDFSSIGFMWNDFHVNSKAPTTYDSGRGFCFGKSLTEQTLKFGSTANHKVRGVFRAHQHSASCTDMMMSILDKKDSEKCNLGLSKLWQSNSCKTSLWDNIVCTFLVGPDSVYGKPNSGYSGFNFDAFGILETATEYENWQLDVYRNMVVPREL